MQWWCTGAKYRPASFVERFRLATRKYLSFQQRISKKGPAYYNCNERQTSCTRREAQSRIGCPNCEFTIQRKIFLAELKEELKHLKRGTWKGSVRWPVKALLETVIEVGSFASKEGDNPNWLVSTALLVSVYRDEVAKLKAIDNFNLMGGSGTSSNRTKSKPVGVPVEDTDEAFF